MKTVNELVWEAIRTGKNAEPWFISGVELVANGITTTNPTPTKTDNIGEVQSLPYVVPRNRVLVIQMIHVNSDPSGVTQVHVKLKVTRPNVSAITMYDLIKYSDHREHHSTTGHWIRESTSVRLDLINAAAGSVYVRYFIEGILVDISSAFKKSSNDPGEVI